MSRGRQKSKANNWFLNANSKKEKKTKSSFQESGKGNVLIVETLMEKPQKPRGGK